MNEEIKSILVEYGERRAKNEAMRNARVIKIYTQYPQIKEIDLKIKRAGADNFKKILNDPENAEKYKRDFDRELKNLRKERLDIIGKNNINPDFDKVKCQCPICRDKGFLENGKKCSCLKQALLNERYLKSNLSEILEKENFENFSFAYYSKNKGGNDKISPYDNIVRVYKRANIFCDNFDKEEKSLIFYGATGLGKTFMSSCIAKRLMDKGKTVLYLRAQQLFDIYESYRFRREETGSIKDVYNCDLLIIDDLGTEQQNKNNFAFLFDLVNERLNSGKKIIINTNLNMNDLNNAYSSRFTSRIYEHFLVYGFLGEDIRVQKLRE